MYEIKFKVYLLETGEDMLTLALGSSMLSFTGMGTLSSNFCSSSFSSCHEERQIIENPQGNGQVKKLSTSLAGLSRNTHRLTSLTVMFLNSEDKENTRKSSISLSVGFSSWL